MHPGKTQEIDPQDPASRLRVAVNTARTGDKTKAREMLLAIAEEDPTQEDVWLWLAGLAEDLHEAKAYLETVLVLNPDHKRAKSGLEIVNQSLSGQGKATHQSKTPVAGAIIQPPPDSNNHRTPDADSVALSPEPSADRPGEAPASENPTSMTPDETVDVNAEITPSFSLSVEQAETIDAYLETMAYESEANSIILADVTGQLISERGETSDINTQVLSALAAGELSATQEMARLVGEEARFSLLLHEGGKRSVYVSPVGAKMLLIVVFASQTPIGLVRIILKKAVDELDPMLNQHEPQDSDAAFVEALNGDFAEQLENEMNTSLNIPTD